VVSRSITVERATDGIGVQREELGHEREDPSFRDWPDASGAWLRSASVFSHVTTFISLRATPSVRFVLLRVYRALDFALRPERAARRLRARTGTCSAAKAAVRRPNPSRFTLSLRSVPDEEPVAEVG
jgi:hypothetical protein